MAIKCGYCKDTIKSSGLSYRGFDCWFCSSTCRVKMWTKIYQIDSNFNNHESWYDKKDYKKWSVQDLVKYDIENQNEKTHSEETLVCSEVSSSSKESNKTLKKTKTIQSDIDLEIDLENGLYNVDNTHNEYNRKNKYNSYNELDYDKKVCNMIIDNKTDRMINNVMFIDKYSKNIYDSITSYLK